MVAYRTVRSIFASALGLAPDLDELIVNGSEKPDLNRAEFPGAVQSMSHSWSGMTSHSNTLWRRPGSAPVAMDYLDPSSRRYRSAGLRPNAKATCSTKAGRPRRRAYQASSRGNAVGAGRSGGEPVQPVERSQVPVAAVDADEPRPDKWRVPSEAPLDGVRRDAKERGQRRILDVERRESPRRPEHVVDHRFDDGLRLVAKDELEDVDVRARQARCPREAAKPLGGPVRPCLPRDGVLHQTHQVPATATLRRQNRDNAAQSGYVRHGFQCHPGNAG